MLCIVWNTLMSLLCFMEIDHSQISHVCLGFVTNLSWFLPSVGPPTYDQATAPFLPSPADPFTWQVSAESAAKSAMESLLGQSLAQTKAGVACLLSSDPRPFVVV